MNKLLAVFLISVSSQAFAQSGDSTSLNLGTIAQALQQRPSPGAVNPQSKAVSVPTQQTYIIREQPVNHYYPVPPTTVQCTTYKTVQSGYRHATFTESRYWASLAGIGCGYNSSTPPMPDGTIRNESQQNACLPNAWFVPAFTTACGG